ncbi:hypothetical protein VDG1235_3449 [Verrucomicrobiia bacterium DG1235]|nr:hypothetical protein VDG1235_3449 [Verrucomicrobiae bacterium DG1235]
MDIVVNDIEWWQISLHSFLNGWLPGVVTFALGLWLARISNHRKLKQELKNSILEIFIPTFNAGQTITFESANEANKKLLVTLNVYENIYPNIFRKKSAKELKDVLSDGFLIDGKVNEKYMNPDEIQNLIKNL